MQPKKVDPDEWDKRMAELEVHIACPMFVGHNADDEELFRRWGDQSYVTAITTPDGEKLWVHTGGM